MKTFLKGLTAVAVSGLLFASCYKEDVRYTPAIVFNTDSGYTHVDTLVTMGAKVYTGIIASRNDSADLLEDFEITKRIDNQPEVIVHSQSLRGVNSKGFRYDYTITARNTPGTETYIYRVINGDREPKEARITLTVR